MECLERLDGWIEHMEGLLKVNTVVAVGECGLDDTSGNHSMKRQLKYFRLQVELAVANKLPLVIHCRGDAVTDNLCFEAVAELVPKDFRIHYHCFNGTSKKYRKWKTAFPNCKFGISPFINLTDRHPNFRSLVCEMELDDIIVETDAPYISPNTHSVRTPFLLQDVLTALSNVFVCSFDEAAQVTTRNAIELYSLRK